VNLSEVGESRINGYLFVLQRSLKTFLPPDTVRDAVREIESHLRERIAAADAAPHEREAVETILAELGPPLRVAQAYSAERTIDEAIATGRFVAMLRAIWHLAATTIVGFFAALGLFIGYAVGFATLAVAALEPIFPRNVGVLFVHGVPVGFGAQFPVPPGTDLRGGYAVIPIAIACGLIVLVLTQRLARKYLAWWRNQRVS
jgi:uncharacterized membrane protein